MTRLLVLFAAALTMLLPRSGATAASLPPNVLIDIDRVARAWVASGHTPGLAVAVMQDGKVVFARGYGLAEIENQVAVQPETVFRIGSISKQFTAAAVLKLVEQGRLSLDDKLSKFYPKFPRANEVTIRELLNHTSGIHNYVEVGEDPLGLRPVMTDYSYTTDEWVDHIEHQSPLYDFSPGVSWHYSNSGYFLAGGIVEKVSGQSLSDYLKEHIFKPAGMNHTAMDTDGALVPLRASGYDRPSEGSGKFAPAHYLTMTAAMGAGGLRSTAADLLKWQETLLSGQVIAQASVKQMLTPGRLVDGRLASKGVYPSPEANAPVQQDYGLGLEIGAVAGHRRVSHSGDIFGFNAVLYAYPDDGLIWVALANSGTGVSEFSPVIEAALFEPPAIPRGAPAN